MNRAKRAAVASTRRISNALVPALALAMAVAPRPAHAIEPVASFRYLVTGNGFGFQVFDVSANAVKHYLERPYRYLRANPSNPDGEGIVRRNLVFDTYFGVKAGGQAAWLGGRAPSETGYVNETNMIRSAVTVGGVSTESFFVAPFGYEGNAMVMLLKVTNTSGGSVPVSAYSIHNFKLGSAPNPDEPGSNNETIAFDAGTQSATESGPGGGTMVYAAIGGLDVSSCADNVFQSVAAGAGLTMTPSCNGSDKKNAFQKDMGSLAPGESKWWGVAVLFDPDGNAAQTRTKWATFVNGRAPDQLYTDLLAEWDAWRKPPPAGLSATETAVWRQAEAVLRMGQILEPYQESPRQKNHGMILASLPPGGWHTGWVRDATYAIGALARTRHDAEAKAALDFFLDADAGKYGSFLKDVNYRISTVRYYGDGEEEADFSGSPTRNIEIDGWGLYMWAARQYVDSSGDVAWLAQPTKKGDTVYDAIRDGVAEPLAANMEDAGMTIADASIWEVHWGNREHFLYTTAASARGFCDMATLARRAGRTDDIERYRALHDKAVESMKSFFIDQNKVLAGSLERLTRGSNYRDGATVEALTWNLIGADTAIGKGTLGAMSFLQTPAGGYKRVEGSTDQYDTDEWILIDLRASAAFRRSGDEAKANQLLDWVTAQGSVNYNLLPELYNTRTSSGAIGAYSGSIPMVGYGAGAYQMTLLDRAGAFENSDCGEFDAGGDGGPGGGDDDGSSDGRTGVACACHGGPGSAGSGAVLLLAFAFVMRRRAVA
ncbi:MAG TPA: glycoside hydrolase family 15 protein [Kofleriaceae bacterium]|nr:glycoside hydrolase family 15 protein [Kofleriaceae bacterium]